MTRLIPVLLLLLAACASPEVSPPAGPPLAPGEYANWRPEAEYVGKATCAECHVDKAASYAEAQMGRSFRPARASLSDAQWDNVEPIRDRERDLYYVPFRRGEDLFVREYRLTNGDTSHVRVVPIDYIVGSGQHTNSHIRDENGYLFQVPLTWYAQDRKWSLPPGFSGGDSFRFDRPITDQCMACHDGPSTYAPESENRFSDIPHGIECENCHGPGSLHVDAIRSGEIVDVTTQIDYNIVNPAKLETARLDDVCQRCHMQGVAVLREGVSPFDYRPGQDLSEHMDVFWPRFPDSTTQFIMASHPARLQMSACWQASRKTSFGGPNEMEPITCLTCHDPHEPVQARSPAAYNAFCIDCHSKQEVAACTESVNIRAGFDDNCSSCHMPASETTDIPNVRITDHFIRVVKPGRSASGIEAAMRTNLVRMASLLRPKVEPEVLAAAYLTFYEEEAYRPYLDSARAILNRLPLESGKQQRVRTAFLSDDWNEVTRIGSTLSIRGVTDAWTAYRLGEGYLTLGQVPKSVEWLERAVALAPEHLRFQTKLGSAYLAMGRLDDSRDVLDRVLDSTPSYATAWNDRGFVRLNQGDIEGAEADFRQALLMNPDLEEALGNLASLLFNTGRVEEARPLANQLLFLEPQNPGYRQFWEAVSGAGGSPE